MFTVVELDVALVLAVNAALVAPAGMVVVVGTVASAASLLARETTDPLWGAGPLSITLPPNEAPPLTVAGFSVREVRLGPDAEGVTVSEAVDCWDAPD